VCDHVPTFALAGLKPSALRHFLLRQVSLDARQVKLVTQSFDIDWNQLSGAKSLRWAIKSSHHTSLCNSQQLTQPSLAPAATVLRFLLSQFTPRVGGG
jgi:hypothetical protein